MDVKNWGRWTARAIRVAALTAGIAGAAAPAFCQSTPSTASKKTYTKNTTFNLPIQMDERMRSSLREVQLYVKSGSSDWVRQESVSPQTPHFTYRVPQDGEYWFSLVTVDRAGKASPADVQAAPPLLRVVVDSRPPAIETSMTMDGAEPVLKVNVVDANPDAGSVRALVVADQGDRALTPIPGQLGSFKLSPLDMNLPIRITAADMSGNLATKEVSGRDLLPPVSAVRNEPPVPPLPLAAPPTLSPTPTAPPYVPPPLPPTAALPTAPPPPAPPTPQPAPPTAYVPPAAPGNVTATVYRPNIDTGNRPGNRKIINTTHAAVDYRIDTVGPSGIGRVDVYLTPDQGQNWTKISEDVDKRSPVEIDLPGEGLFGIRLAITNGNGFGGKAPKAGDRPSFFIEVDATSPFVQLQPIDMVAGSGAIDIRWTASDANMGSEPVSIFYRTRSDGTWQPMVRNIKNEGSYRWAFPRDIGPQFFLKIEVADLAGNVTKVETPTPILLDTTEPEATLVDVTGRGASAPPSLGPTR